MAHAASGAVFIEKYVALQDLPEFSLPLVETQERTPPPKENF